MPIEVELGKFYSNSKTLQSNYNAGEFLHGIILHAPISRRNPAEDMRSEDNAEEDGERRFGEVEVISQEEREESV